MRNLLIIAVITILAVSACNKNGGNTSGMYRSDAEMIGSMINNNLINSGDLPEYVDVKSDDYVVLELILDYNEENDQDKFASNNGRVVKNNALKRKLLLLSNNLLP